jgi:hypothetical protein
MTQEVRSDRVRLESNGTPRFRADETGDKVTEIVMETEGFSILESCLGRPISKNSVLEGLGMKRFAESMKRIQQYCTFEKRKISTELIRRERNEKLNVVSAQMVMNRRFRDDDT